MASETSCGYTGACCCARRVPMAPSAGSEVRMSEADPTALIERLRRANRRWKALAALLAIALMGATASLAVQHRRAAAALRAAEGASRAEREARRDAERQRAEAERSKEQVERMLYMRNIGLAARAWEEAGLKR